MLDRQARSAQIDTRIKAHIDAELVRLSAREKELKQILSDDYYDDYPHSAMSMTLWHEYRQHGVLPFAGGYLDQPEWFLQDVIWLELQKELHNIPVDIARLKDYRRTAK